MDANQSNNDTRDGSQDIDDIPVGRHEQHRLANEVIDTLIQRC